MLNKVDYWLELADDDVITARMLVEGKRHLHAGFFCHLIVEKALKAMIESVTSEPPPKIHDLAKLAERAGISDELTDEQVQLLKELNPLQIEALYPEYKERIASTLTNKITARLLVETEDFLCWIKQKLEK